MRIYVCRHKHHYEEDFVWRAFLEMEEKENDSE